MIRRDALRARVVTPHRNCLPIRIKAIVILSARRDKSESVDRRASNVGWTKYTEPWQTPSLLANVTACAERAFALSDQQPHRSPAFAVFETSIPPAPQLASHVHPIVLVVPIPCVGRDFPWSITPDALDLSNLVSSMPKNPAGVSRRSVLDLGAKAAASLGLSSLLPTLASGATLECACVCVYLLGGNDSNNMIVPLDSPAFDAYAQGRGNLALPKSSLLSVESPATLANYGFHPALAGVQELYERGVLAVVANVGRTDQALVKGRFSPSQLPSDLFVHSSDPEVQYLSGGVLGLPWDPDPTRATRAPDPSVNSATLTVRLQQIATAFSRDGARSTYTVTLSGFDTHANELSTQARLFAELNDALVSFYQQLTDLGINDRVTIFTATDFNRTLAPNARGGSDHAWGGHNLVLGGSVRGGRVYGRFPNLQLGGPDDLGSNGVWIPSTSSQEYSASIARWYGARNFSTVFPKLRGFSSPDLGFLPVR